jgi:hypothetical protein
VPTRSFTEADQKIAAAVGERKRFVKRSTFDLEPPIAGHPSFPKRFGGHGASRLCPSYARCLTKGSLNGQHVVTVKTGMAIDGPRGNVGISAAGSRKLDATGR